MAALCRIKAACMMFYDSYSFLLSYTGYTLCIAASQWHLRQMRRSTVKTQTFSRLLHLSSCEPGFAFDQME